MDNTTVVCLILGSLSIIRGLLSYHRDRLQFWIDILFGVLFLFLGILGL